MTNRNKTKGSAWERAIVECLRASGWPHAERRIAGAALDRGDIAGLPGVVIEAKNTARLDLAGWIQEAETERVNDNAYLGVVWHKRRGKAAAADGYVTMTGAQFVELLGDALLNRPVEALPAPAADRATVLREAADALDNSERLRDFTDDHMSDINEAANELRRMAAEAQQGGAA